MAIKKGYPWLDKYETTLGKKYGAVPVDAQYLNDNPHVMQHLVNSTLETQSVSSAGIIAAIKSYADSRVEPANSLDCEITLWYGDEDVIARAAHMLTYLGDFPTNKLTTRNFSRRRFYAGLSPFAGCARRPGKKNGTVTIP